MQAEKLSGEENGKDKVESLEDTKLALEGLCGLQVPSKAPLELRKGLIAA